MKFFDGRFLIYDSATKFKASELTLETLEKQGGEEEIRLRHDTTTGLVLPFALNKPLNDPNGSRNLGGWINTMINNSDKKEMAKPKLRENLEKLNTQFTDEDIDILVNVPLELDAKRNSAVDKRIISYASGDWTATNDLRRRVLVEDVSYPHPNKTFNQNSNEDQVGIRLPDADVIVTHTIGEPYAETPFRTTFSPYPNSLYRMKQISAILSAATPAIRLEHINRTITMLKEAYNMKLPDAEVKRLTTAFPLLPLEHVLGNSDNDSVELYENEKPFYENLIEFIKYHIYKFNREVMADATDEEVKEKSDIDYATGQLPLRLSEYLETVLYDVLFMNFYHTGNFNFVVGDLDVSEDSESSNDGEKDNMAMIVSKEDVTQSDLHIVAANYLVRSAKTFSASVWAEGIVKLMRWGDRKVRNLNVGVNNTQYFDLQSTNLITQQLADLSNFEVIADEEGRTLDVIVCAYCDFSPSSSKRVQSYPFILMGREYGTVPEIDKEVPVTYLTTLFDIVKTYLNGAPNIYDLGFDGTKFFDEVDREPLVVLDRVDLFGKNRKIKLSDELMEYGIDNNISKMQGTAYSVLKPEELSEFLSSEPLLERLSSTPKPMRTSLVQGGLLSIFQEGAVDYSEENLVDLLNWYYQEVYPIHLEAYNKLFGFESAGKSQLNAKNLPTANFFNTGVTEVAEETKEERSEFMYPIYSGEELAFNKITKSKDDTTVVGGYAVSDGGIIFASTSEITSYAVESKTVHIGAVLQKMFKIMLAADTNTGYVTKDKVISEMSIHDIYKALDSK